MRNLSSTVPKDVPGCRHVGPILLRATTYDSRTAPPDPPDCGGEIFDPDSARAWLRTLWLHEGFRDAVAVASPVLAGQVDATLATDDTPGRQLRRLTHSLVSYLLRWQGRPTPFGLFAGVVAATEGADPVVAWGSAHRVVARPDATWLSTIVGRLEQDATVLDRLPVMTNSAMTLRGDLFVVPGQPPDDQPTTFAPLEVTLRRTDPIATAIQDAIKPVRFAELVNRLAGRYLRASPGQIRCMLTGLVEQRFLITALRAPMTETDALGYLMTALENARVGDLPGPARIVEDLRRINVAVVAHNGTLAATSATREGIIAGMQALASPSAQPLPVDLRLDCTVTVPPAVLREAGGAASALLRLSPYPFGYGHWREYHVRFRRRYGPRAVVPVLDLVADSGLGLPASYLGSGVNRPPQPWGARDETLLALLHEALRHGQGELILNDTMIETLCADVHREGIPPARVELAFQVHAEDLDSLADGTFRLWVTGVPRPDCSMAGRFLDLLDPAEQQRWAASYTHQPSRIAGAADLPAETERRITAQLSFPTRLRRSDNVARTPDLLPVIVPLAEYRDPSEAVLALGDIGVTGDASGFALVHLPTGRMIDVSVLHTVDAGHHTPPLARYLAEITGARCTAYHGFDWGVAASSPYLPRVRYGRTVLCPARWLLTTAQLPGRSASDAHWAAALRTWQQGALIPATIVLVEDEQRLPLDLDHPMHRTLLRTRLDRTGTVELREAPPAGAYGALGRAHEFLIPLAPTVGSVAERLLPVAAPVEVVHRGAGQLPGGSPWLCLRLFAHPARFDDILVTHLPRLFAGWDAPPWWWFDRHRDLMRPADEQHLILCLQLGSAPAAAAALTRAADWAADLRQARLLARLEASTYQRQTGRFGHGPAMDAAEQVFAADTAAAISQLVLARRAATDPLAITAASLTDVADAYLAAPGAGSGWLVNNLPIGGGPLDRDVRDTTLRLADSAGNFATLRSLPGGEAVFAAWRQRRAALTAYSVRLRSQRDPEPVLDTLLHLHHVRMLGIDEDRETTGRRLARAAAQRDLARSSRTDPEPPAGEGERVAP
jgi:lantibiotic biosynthesis protein